MGLAQARIGSNNTKDTAEKTPVGEPCRKRPGRVAGKILWATGFVSAILSLVAAVTFSRQSGELLQAATAAVTHTRQVLEKLADISAKLSEVESAARSFAISGKQSHLNPFYIAAKAVLPQVVELKHLLRDDPNQLQSLTEIEPVIVKHLKVMKDMVELGNRSLLRGYGQRGLTDEGNTLMEQSRVAFSSLEKEQRTRLDQQQTAVANRAEQLLFISLVGIIVAGMLVLACGVCALHARHGREKAEEKLER